MNLATVFVLLSPWATWLVWEIYLLLRRGPLRLPGETPVKTISMVARDLRFHITSIVYLSAGMLAHWWWLGPQTAGVVGGIAFWAIALALLVQDICLARGNPETWPKWLRIQRDPPAWLVVGALAGRFLFPQAAP